MDKEIVDKIKKYKLAFAFNGGKESVVVFHLIQQHFDLNEIVFFNVASVHDFSEIKEFVQKIRIVYDIPIYVFGDIKQAIVQLKEIHGITGIIMGNRNSDPNCTHLKAFSPTDKNYPSIMRINPIISWTYNDVWIYIDKYHLEVCSLYDKGYTSIGHKHNTKPNHMLKTDNGYRHARELSDETKERSGRIEKIIIS